MSTVRTNNILDASGGNTATINSMTPTADSLQGFRNRIINGDMRIDQRNAGASVSVSTLASTYAVDRFSCSVSQTSKCTIQQNAGSITPPTGFSNYYGFTVGASANVTVAAGDYFVVQQRIEGNNLADLNFGRSTAQTFTVSFWVRSSLTGSFGFALQNGAQTRSYATTYTINSANTWEYKTITIAGDTTGTWATDNTAGLVCSWGLGVGSTYAIAAGSSWSTTSAPNGFGVTGTVQLIQTNSATFYITGVQLEVGSTATPFERRPYGTELMLCQRYFQKSYDQANALGTVTTTGEVRWQAGSTGGESAPTIMLPVVMRTAPTLTIYSAATGASGNVRNYSTAADVVMTTANVIGSRGWSGGSTGFTAGNIIGYQFAASSEL